MKKIRLVLACLTLMMSITATPLFAGTVQGNLNVSLTIGNGCELTGGDYTGAVNQFGNLSFGQYSSLSNIIDSQSTGASTGNMQMVCTTGTAYTVSLDNGLHASGAQRRMIGPAGAFINYNLFQDAPRATAWAAGTPLAATGAGTPVDLIVYGRVPAQTTPAAGAYADTVTMTVTW